MDLHIKYSVYVLTLNFWNQITGICQNKRPECLISRSKKKDSTTHQSPSVLCTPPFEKSPIKSLRFVYSPLWKITVFGGRLFRGGRLFGQIRWTFLKNQKFTSFKMKRLGGPTVNLTVCFTVELPVHIKSCSALYTYRNKNNETNKTL